MQQGEKMHRFLPILLISMLVYTAYAAGTVTLTGTCRSNLNQNGSINFSIANSGTESASSVVLQSYYAFSDKLTGTYSTSQISPDKAALFDINSSIGNNTGSFAYYFLVTYQQGTQLFTVVFPCVVQNHGAHLSLLGISNVTVQDINSTTAKVNGSIYSFSSKSISGNITLILPPELERNGSRISSFAITPYQYHNFTLYSNLPSQNNTYSGAVALEYSSNGTTYSSVYIIKITPYSAGQNQLKGYLVQAAIIAIIIIIALLILRQRIMRKRRAVQE